MVSEPASWLALSGLGAFHGLNPAMGWLFAVALGLHRQNRRIVLLSLLPIALGHAVSIAVVTLAVVLLGFVIDLRLISIGAGVMLVGWAVYHTLYGHRHRVRVGMQTGLAGLGLWSFLMATAHGAGLMLVPVILPTVGHDMAGMGHGMAGSLSSVLVATLIHTGAMLVVTGVVAVAVYEWVGLAFLRRGWINMDIIWTAALVIAGLILIL